MVNYENGANVPKNAFSVVMGALKGSKLYQEGKNFVETNFTEEGQRKKAFENTDFDSLDGMSADDQVNFVKGLRGKLPAGAQLADSFDTLGLDMSRTNEDGSYSIDGGSIGYGEGKALGLMSEDGSLDNDKLKEMISGNYDDYSDEQKAAIENVACINKNIMKFAYDEKGVKISQTDAGKDVEGFLSQIDDVSDLKKFQEGSVIDKAATMKDVVSGAMSNMATMDGAQIKLDADSMNQYGAYSSMMEAAKNGELTSDMAKDYLAKAYGIENPYEPETSLEDGVEVNGKTITKDDLKELFNTKDGQAMMSEATDEWEQQMMDENPMLNRNIGKSKNVEGFLSQIDDVSDFTKFQVGSVIDKAAAKNGALTSDMAKDYLTKAYGIGNGIGTIKSPDGIGTIKTPETFLEDGVEVNGKTITKDDLKELFNTKEGQAMMAEATDEWEQQMMDENPMLDRSIGKSKFDSIVRGAEVGMQAGYAGKEYPGELFSRGADGMEDFTDLDGMDETTPADGKVITGEYRPARDAKDLPDYLPNADVSKDKHAERVEQAEALSDGLEKTGSESEMQML